MTPLPLPPAAPYRINRIYLKSASVEVPRMAELPRQAEQPHIGVDMQTSAQAAWDGALECVLRITLQGRLQGKSIFALEVSEAGIFELEGSSSQEEVTRFVRQIAASVLFPFARKDLAMLAVSAGFQPILLDHIDFDALLTRVIEQHRASLRVPGPTLQATLQAQRPTPTSPPRPTAEPVVELPQTTPPALPTPMAGASTNRRLPIAAGLLLLTLAVGLAGWYTQSQRVAPLAATPMAAPPQPPASPLTPSPPPPPPPLPAATQQALQVSAHRLAEQPPDWFTIELGQIPAHADLAGLDALPADRPLYLRQPNDETLLVLYGAFPTAEAAEATLVRLTLPTAASLPQGTARVTRLGTSSP